MFQDSSSSTAKVLETMDLAIGYTDKKAVIASGIDISARAGEFICLVGPNGVGKSTLLRTLAGVQHPVEGNVILKGRNIKLWSRIEKARKVAVVSTERRDPAGFSVFDIVALGRFPHTDWKGRLSGSDRSVVEKVLGEVKAEHLTSRDFLRISDGERQRIMVARALAQEPEILFLDEPTAFLDLVRRVEILQILKRLSGKKGMTIIMAIHDISLAIDLADRIWLFNPSEGIIDGSPEDLVLKGEIQRTFSTEELVFDPVTGNYPSATALRGDVSLEGSGQAVYWTARALKRNGFRVRGGVSTNITVRIEKKEETLSWSVLKKGEKTGEYPDIHSLVEYLKDLF